MMLASLSSVLSGLQVHNKIAFTGVRFVLCHGDNDTGEYAAVKFPF